MSKEKLSLIEKTIIDKKRMELYEELLDLSALIRRKKYEIMTMAGIDTDGKNIVSDFLIDVIKEDKLTRRNDFILSKETEEYFLEKGVNELLNK
ncbi:MFS transporter [Bacillus sp. C1]